MRQANYCPAPRSRRIPVDFDRTEAVELAILALDAALAEHEDPDRRLLLGQLSERLARATHR